MIAMHVFVLFLPVDNPNLPKFVLFVQNIQRNISFEAPFPSGPWAATLKDLD